MSIFDKAKGIAGDLVGKAQDVAGGVAGKGRDVAGGVVSTVKDTIGGDRDDPTGTAARQTAPTAPDVTAEPPASSAADSDDVVTPADVAEAVSDPDLPHPERPAE